MINEIEKLDNIIQGKFIEYNISKKAFKRLKLQARELSERIETLEEYKALIIELGEQSQQEIKSYLENVVTQALHTIYGEDYSFVIQLEERKEQSEIHFFLNKDGVLLEPREDTVGGSVVDIISYILHIAVLMLDPSNLPISLQDEPLKNTKRNRLQDACDVLKNIPSTLNIQQIIISHEDELISAGDKIIRIGE